jgi:hypothetical protein
MACKGVHDTTVRLKTLSSDKRCWGVDTPFGMPIQVVRPTRCILNCGSTAVFRLQLQSTHTWC